MACAEATPPPPAGNMPCRRAKSEASGGARSASMPSREQNAVTYPQHVVWWGKVYLLALYRGKAPLHFLW